MTLEKFDPNDEESFDRMRDLFGPGQVDQLVRQALQACWMMLPKAKRTVDELERQFRHIVDRALRNLREDGEAFQM